MCDKCACCHVPDLGACGEFVEGYNGRCVYCDHDEGCHPGEGLIANGPLWPIGLGVNKWSMVMDALSELNRVFHLIGKDSDETRAALDYLMQRYDDWLD